MKKVLKWVGSSIVFFVILSAIATPPKATHGPRVAEVDECTQMGHDCLAMCVGQGSGCKDQCVSVAMECTLHKGNHATEQEFWAEFSKAYQVTTN
jgi:hypothetical protein